VVFKEIITLFDIWFAYMAKNYSQPSAKVSL